MKHKFADNEHGHLKVNFTAKEGTCENFDRDARVSFFGLKFTKISFFGLR